MISDIQDLEAESQREIAKGSFKLLELLHHLTSGMKALFSEITYVGADELR